MSPFPPTIRIEGAKPEEVIMFNHDWTGETELGPSLIMAVVELTDGSPEEIGMELRQNVNFDGLDRVFQPPTDGILQEGGQLALSLTSCEITISSDGWVEVEHTSE